MADDGRVKEQLGIVAGRRIEATAGLDPVVALVAEQEIQVVAAEDEIVAGAAEHFGHVDADEDRVLAGSAHQDVDAVRVGDDVVALVALDEVARIAGVGDESLPAPPLTRSTPAPDSMRSSPASPQMPSSPKSVMIVSLSLVPPTTTCSPPKKRKYSWVIRASVPGSCGHLAEAHRLEDGIVAGRINAGSARIVRIIVGLVGRVDLEHVVVGGEGIDADMAQDDVVARAADTVRARLGQIRVRHDHLGERVLLERIQEVLPLGAGQVEKWSPSCRFSS